MLFVLLALVVSFLNSCKHFVADVLFQAPWDKAIPIYKFGLRNY